MGLNLDTDPANADWAKQAWDLQIDNIADLRAWLNAHGVTPGQFKEAPVYKANVNKPGMEWLKQL